MGKRRDDEFILHFDISRRVILGEGSLHGNVYSSNGTETFARSSASGTRPESAAKAA